MGQEKAFLQLNGRMLIDFAILHAHAVADDIFIVGPREKFGAFGRIVNDIYQNSGPLGGLHAALDRSRTNLSLMLAVDTPFVTAEFLKYMVREAQSSKAVVTVPRTQDGLQPLCAIYSRDFLAIAKAALDAGNYKIDPLFPPEKTCTIDLARHPEFSPAMFQNINSPEDFARAEQATAGQSQSAKQP